MMTHIFSVNGCSYKFNDIQTSRSCQDAEKTGRNLRKAFQTSKKSGKNFLMFGKNAGAMNILNPLEAAAM